jgi:hypothetical protein
MLREGRREPQDKVHYARLAVPAERKRGFHTVVFGDVGSHQDVMILPRLVRSRNTATCLSAYRPKNPQTQRASGGFLHWTGVQWW